MMLDEAVGVDEAQCLLARLAYIRTLQHFDRSGKTLLSQSTSCLIVQIEFAYQTLARARVS